MAVQVHVAHWHLANLSPFNVDAAGGWTWVTCVTKMAQFYWGINWPLI